MTRDRHGRLVLLVASSSIAFIWVVAPLRSALVWAIVVAMLCSPGFRLLERRLPGRRNLAAGLTVMAMILTLVLPAMVVAGALLRQATSLVTQQGASVHLPASLQQVHAALPEWLHGALRSLGVDDAEAFRRYCVRFVEGTVGSLLGGAVGLGQGAFTFSAKLGVMIYVSFFFIRDGRQIYASIGEHLPVPQPTRGRLLNELHDVLRATLRGSLIVAIVQGSLGGVIFWAIGIPAPALWAVAMAFMSLLPPFGSAVVWVPVALFLLVIGAVWQGIALIACGLFVIGLVDNFLRPLLVGREARMPEFLVLVSTLGGLTLVGVDGIVIGPLIVSAFLLSWQEWRASTADAGRIRDTLGSATDHPTD